MKKSFVISVFILLWTSFAQLSDEARAALREGKTAAANALNRYGVPNPDQELWKLALQYGREAERLAPDHPAPQRFLAQVYSTLGWYKRAWDAWQGYEARGGVLGEDAKQKYSEMSVAMGYLSYQQGQREEALNYYQQANLLQPENDEALVWVALLYFELEQPHKALGYWQEVVKRQPENPRFITYLEQTQSQLQYGTEASHAFYKGVEAEANGEPQVALNNFARAVRLNPNYLEALVRGGTLSLELENPQAAVRYWQRALALNPGDSEVEASLELAELQTQWGVEAVNQVQTGLMLLENKQLESAKQAFADATKANPSYGAAWAWLGRLEASLGNEELALTAFERATRLEPANTAYANAYAGIQQRLNEQAARARQEVAPQEIAPQEIAPQEIAPQAISQQEIPQQGMLEQEMQQEAEIVTETPTPVVETPSTSETLLEDLGEIAALQSQAQSERIRTFVQPFRTQEIPTPDAEREGTTLAPPLVLLETTHTHRSEDGGLTPFIFFESSKSLQSNLMAPTNYAAGTVHQRLEVLQKPSDLKVHYQFCLVPNDDITIRPTCSETDTLGFTSTGVYEVSQPLISFTDYADVNWSKGISEFILILRDSYGNPVGNESSHSNQAMFDLEMFYPMKIRYTAVLVPEGGTFSGWPEELAFEP